ncbi:MAG: tRNA lysidine(34) synthetase TilS [Firmicutes bacterium]|nr:tRNA lysidine(34) synthetase TilS [Bacillota bacterium]
MKLLQRIQHIIEEYELLQEGDGVIVGCSGGPDSMCLLHLLMELKEDMELTLRVVHLEHGFRGEASEADAQYVEAYCREHGIDCVVYRERVRELAKESGISEEMAGRQVRYQRFFQERRALIEQLQCDENQVKIAVAHNKNDQVETVLMRILRGTGLEGLCGMELKRGDGVIRPLLTTDRREIEAYCEERGLQPCWDHTNDETDYTRNKIRLELIPYLKEHFNENVEEALLRLSDNASQVKPVIQAQVEEAVKHLEKDENGRVIDRRGLSRLEDGLRHQVVHQTLKDLGMANNASAIHLKQIDDLLRSKAASGSVDLPGPYCLAVAYDRILWPCDEDAEQSVSVGSIKIHQRDRWQGDTIAVLRRLSENRKCFDYDKILAALGRTEGPVTEEDLTLRFRKPGDVFRSLGSPGRKKLQDWFVDRKIPRQVRDKTPLVCIGSEILWITGYQISENFKVDEQTKRLIFVEFHQ